MAVVVTAKSGYDIAYPVRSLGKDKERGYYAEAARLGEAPGRWFGRGAQALGLAEGQPIFTDAQIGTYLKVYRQVHPVTGEKLGRAAAGAAKVEERRLAYLAELLAAEPHATKDRQRALAWQATVETRPTAPYTDVTVSFSKSVSVLHASIRENARQARAAGDAAAAAWWDQIERRFSEILQQGNLAALRHVQEWAGVTRTGSHAARTGADQETGRWEPAGLVVSSWLQGTSRDGDPHDHVHNLFARMVHTDRDGKWRALDTMALRYQLPAMNAIAAAHMEAALTREFGVEWVPREDGAGNEIRGVTQELIDEFSRRQDSVNARTRELAQLHEQRYGRAPNQQELMWLKDLAWEITRDSKPDVELDWDAHCADLNARVGGKLGRVAHGVSRSLRGPGASLAPDAQTTVLSIAQRAAVGAKALARVHEQRATFSRADLLKAVSAELPPSSRRMDPAAVVTLVCDLADQAMAGDFGPVLAREAPEWPAPPDYLRRAIDGRSVYTRPGADRYATGVQLSMEQQLVCAAQTQRAACLSRADAARLLGADADALHAVLRESVRDATDRAARVGGLRLDQAAAAYHLLTSPRTVEVLVGPAGSGKTRTLASVARAAAAAGRPVLGLATSHAGRNALADAGVPEALNTAQFLGHGKDGQRGARGIRALAPGTFILLDEASMTSTPDLRDIATYAARHGHKLIVCGDHAQLSAVESGGGMSLLVDQLGHVELGEAVRFAEPWEQDASLRLRQSEVAVLAVYDDHGRIRGNAPAEAMEDARRLYVARYVQGQDVELIIASNALSHEMARRIRDDLQHLGTVSDGPEVQLADEARASAGDVIIARDNDHHAGVANSDVLRIEAIHPDGTITVRRRLDRDEATGQRRWADDTFPYRGYATADLSYGATAHTKQGKTVTATVTLVTGTESAEWLYSAMTRGTDSNIACVFTHPTGDPAEQSAATRPAPELARADLVDAERNARPLPTGKAGELPGAREALAVLADITSRRSAELSATTMGRRNLAHADHLAHLHAIWQGETTALSVNRYRQAIREALPAAWATDPLDSPQATWLWRTLRQAEAAGLDICDIARQAVEKRSLDGARDLAAVLDARIRRDHPVMIPAQWRSWAEQVPETPDAEQQDYLRRLAAAMDGRKERLGAFAAQAQPAWATAAAGPVPADPAQRAEWERRVSHVGAYRELYGWDHSAEPVGPEPSGDTPEKRAAWHAAYGAMTRLEGVDLRGRSDGSLHKMRDTYRVETEWAPPHVAEELRAVRHGRTDMAAHAARADAMAEAARKTGDEQLAAAHEQLAAGARWADAFYAQIEDMDAEIMTHREEWARVTEGSRYLAVLADAELRRRYPGARLDPLHSAEPDEPIPALPDPREPDSQITARLEAHKETSSRFRERLEERQGVRIPNEDPDYQYEGEAWPSPWQPWDRDAVLKPPQPEIRPALEVERLAAARDTELEAGL